MLVAPISCLIDKINGRNSVSFKGEPSQSFYKYLEIARKESKNPEANKIAVNIADAIKTFMQPLNKDTIFSIYNKKDLKYVTLPNYPYKAASWVDTGNYQTIFFNKKTGTKFAMHEISCIRYGDDKYMLPKERQLLLANKLESLKKHVDNIVEFFSKDKEFNVDTVLYNLIFEKRDFRYENSLIPFKFLRNFIYNKDTQKAEKLAAEFNIDDKSKPLKVFINPFA